MYALLMIMALINWVTFRIANKEMLWVILDFVWFKVWNSQVTKSNYGTESLNWKTYSSNFFDFMSWCNY